MDKKKETGQKFSSGKIYKENSIDFNSFLTGNFEPEEDIAEINDVEKNKKDENPVEKPITETKGKENASPETFQYENILLQAMEDDNEFDELEDGFEEETKKLTKLEETKKSEKVTKTQPLEKDSSLKEEPKTNKPLSKQESSAKDTKKIEKPTSDDIKDKSTNKKEEPEEVVSAPIENKETENKVEDKEEPEAIKKESQKEEKIEEAIKKEENQQTDNIESQKEENVEVEKLDMTADELFEQIVSDSQKNVGKKIDISEIIGEVDGDSVVASGKVLKNKFNPNPDKNLIEGLNFNDPLLNDIYGYTYSDEICDIRERKAVAREEKLKKYLEEQAKKEAEKAKRAELEATKNKKRKQKQQEIEEKLPENIRSKKHALIPKSYPKQYIDPTIETIDENTNQVRYDFSFRKTLESGKGKFLTKILPVNAIDEVLYDKSFAATIAEKQHEKNVRLNSMTAGEQFARDIRKVAVVLAMFFVLFFAINLKYKRDIIPDRQYANAVATLNNKFYDQAYNMFTQLGNKELSVYYAKYSEAKMYQKTEQYEKAIEAFNLLVPYNDSIFKNISVNINDEINECHYQTALTLYYDGDFEGARKIFKEIYNYSDAIEKYYDCGYRIAKELYESSQNDEDNMNALVYFYKIRKYANNDVQNTINIISNNLYSSANKLYDRKEYEEALYIFKFLEKYNYVNTEEGISAELMSKQCTYRYGLDLFKNKEYEKASKVLDTIPEYKDSYVLKKECVYNIALKEYEDKHVASIDTLSSIPGYKTTDNLLSSPKLIMYGKWKITNINGSSISPFEFNFYEDGRFVTTTPIENVAISKKDNPIYYTWTDGCFATDNGKYTIECMYNPNQNTISLTCKNNETLKTTTYEGTKLLSLSDMLLAESKEETSVEGTQMLHKQFSLLIQEYINKKADNMININGTNTNIFKGKID